MVLQKWLLPSLSEILAQSEQTGFHDHDKVVSWVGQTTVTQQGHADSTSRQERERASGLYDGAQVKAQREWKSAIATLEQLLLQSIATSGSDAGNGDSSSLQGLILAGPAPVLSHSDLITHFQTGIFTTEAYNAFAWMPFQLPPAKTSEQQQLTKPTCRFPLLPADPLAGEQFCLVFTNSFSLVMACGKDRTGVTAFRFSFDPEDIQQAWISLRPRMLLSNPHQLTQLETLLKQFTPKTPDYRLVMHFGRQLLKNLPQPSQTEKIQTISVNCEHPRAQTPQSQPASDRFTAGRHWEPLVKNEERGSSKISNPGEATPDVELLQALTHEIRTPLTTIRTLTKLLLKRRDLAPEVIRRLEIIDHECTEQINRMELIFRAIELETAVVKQMPVNLTSMSLEQIFQHSIPLWQKQAERRNLSLDVVLPQKLPTVVSNPAMLDQVLTGLMENFTRSLPAGSQIQVQVTPAGDQLKVQFQSQADPAQAGNSSKSANSTCPTGKSIGELLMFQPETGSVCLNLDVTKHLFQALGGKLIVRQRPQEGEVMTIFLPLEVNNMGLKGQKGIFC